MLQTFNLFTHSTSKTDLGISRFGKLSNHKPCLVPTAAKISVLQDKQQNTLLVKISRTGSITRFHHVDNTQCPAVQQKHIQDFLCSLCLASLNRMCLWCVIYCSTLRFIFLPQPRMLLHFSLERSFHLKYFILSVFKHYNERYSERCNHKSEQHHYKNVFVEREILRTEFMSQLGKDSCRNVSKCLVPADNRCFPPYIYWT